MVNINCDYCNKVFNRRPSHIYKTNFCCVECRDDYLRAINSNTWVRKKCKQCGKLYRVRKTQIKYRGSSFCSKGCYREGQVKVSAKFEKHPAWKGETASYRSKHRWIVRVAGKPTRCKACGGKRFIEWSNKDHKYRRDRKDWQQLCSKCHKKYDRKLR